MMDILASAAVMYSCAFGAAYWLRRGGRGAIAAAVVLIVVAVLSICWIPSHHTILRGISAFLAIDLVFKTVDYLRQRRIGPNPGSLGEYLRFLIPFPVLLVVLELRERRLAMTPPIRPEFARLLVGAAGFAFGSSLLYFAWHVPILRNSFLIDHLFKLLVVLILAESGSQVFHAAERLFGYDTTPPMQRVYLSRTVGEFWWRWNNRVHAFFHYNVFLPTGGRRAPVRGVLHAFFWSGVLHEVMLGVVTSRIDGYQFAFFMVQAPAVLASRRLERFAQTSGMLGKTIVQGLTICWISVTSILFFHAIHRVFGFVYVSQQWLSPQ
jgi:hypothetical protein